MNMIKWANKPQTKGFTDLEHHKFYQCRSSLVRAVQAHGLQRKLQIEELSAISNPEKYVMPSIEITESEIDDMALRAFNEGGVWVVIDNELTLTKLPVSGDVPYGK